MRALCPTHDLLTAQAQPPHSRYAEPRAMTEQQTLDQPLSPPPSSPPAAPPADPAPRRTVGVRVLIGSAVAAFVLGTLVGGGFGALIGYVAHPDGPGDGVPFQQQGDLPQRPDFGAGEVPQDQSNS